MSGKINLKEKFKYLFQEDTRYYIITGGRGGSKSFSVGTFLCLLSYEQDQKILFTRKTMTSAHISVIPEFNEKIELLEKQSDFKVNKTEINNKYSGSDIMFRGLQSSNGDNTANLKSIQGVSCWVLDEAEELTDEAMFDKVDLSIRSKKKHNRVILILNPTTKEHFIFKRFFEGVGVEPGFNGVKENITYIHTTYLDNVQHLSKSFLDQVAVIKERNLTKYNHVILGGWLDKAEGVVFTNWKIGKFEDNGKSLYGQDYGFSIDPTTLVKICIDKSLKRIYFKELLYKTKMTTSEIADINLRYCGKDLIIADSAEPRLIDELKAKDCNIKGAVKGQGSVSAGIAIMQDYELIIDPESTNLIKELNNYVWSDKKSNTPIDAYNHCFIGATLITTENGLIPIKDIKEGDFVLTSKGYKKVLKKFNNGVKQVNKYTMQTDIFSISLCSTKEHKIKSTKWIKISELQSGIMVYLHKPSMETNLDYTQENFIFQEAQKECTFKYGSQFTGKRQKDFIYTIKIIIHGITQLIISNALRVKNIFQTMLKKGLKMIQNLLKCFNQKELRKQKNGTHQMRVENGIQNMEKEHGSIESIKNIVANNVEKNLNQGIQESLNTAIITARLKHFEKGESWEEEVYDIMVEDCHEYLANGILVHNCLDAARYAITHEITNRNEVFFF